MMTTLACSSTNLSVAYRAEPVLRNVDFQVPVGSVTGIVGPNGAGKSTLMKAMLGLVKPLTGQARFFDQPLAKVRQRVGYMPQSTSVDWDFPTTVADVVTMGTSGALGWLRRPGKRERRLAFTAMAQTRMTDLATRQMGEQSGEQRQRVFLAHTLVQNPELYSQDEPFRGSAAKYQQPKVATM